MADADLIASLYLTGPVTSRTTAVLEKCPHYVTAVDLESLARSERGATEPLEEHSAFADEPRLEFRFRNGPRTSRGYVFGRNVNCDCVLPALPGISNFHFAIDFDERNRLIIQDLGSTDGTAVEYAREGEEPQGMARRKNFCWIIGGDATAAQTTIPVKVAKLRFLVVANAYDPSSPLIEQNIQNFRQGIAGVEHLLGRLSVPVAQTTGATTPTTGLIRIVQFLGRGAFGKAQHVWDVTTGSEYVEKWPVDTRARKFKRSAWDREAAIMRELEHVSLETLQKLVRLIKYTADPTPVLHLEYMPGGSLRQYNDLSLDECYQLCTQLCSGLMYLHDRRITHRDIKTENILVRHRGGRSISVAFADFGLSKQDQELETICGTWKYIAPEIKSGDRRGAYTSVVDIWSLAVVLLEVLHWLPTWRSRYESEPARWAKRLIQVLDDNQGTLPMWDALSNMLVLDPAMRFTAEKCLAQLQAHTPTGITSAVETNSTPSTSGWDDKDRRGGRSGAPSLQSQRGAASPVITAIWVGPEDTIPEQAIDDIAGPSTSPNEVRWEQVVPQNEAEEHQDILGRRPLNPPDRSWNQPGRSWNREGRSWNKKGKSWI